MSIPDHMIWNAADQWSNDKSIKSNFAAQSLQYEELLKPAKLWASKRLRREHDMLWISVGQW